MKNSAFLSSRDEFQAITSAIDQYRDSLEETLRARDQCVIWCRACGGVRSAQTTLQPRNGDWINLIEGLVCTECGLNGRMRMILKALDSHCDGGTDVQALVLERVTPLFPHLLARFPSLIGSEFVLESGAPGGGIVMQSGISVRHENLLELSFADGVLDLVMHFDVLEHVPDWRRALRECYRVLRRGGRVCFTLPFFHGLERNIVRAEIKDGELVHHLPAAYHGNPIDGRGSLVYIHPSWEVIDGLREAGFTDVRMAFCFDPLEGIVSSGCPYPDGHTWPVVFFASRGGQ